MHCERERIGASRWAEPLDQALGATDRHRRRIARHGIRQTLAGDSSNGRSSEFRPHPRRQRSIELCLRQDPDFPHRWAVPPGLSGLGPPVVKSPRHDPKDAFNGPGVRPDRELHSELAQGKDAIVDVRKPDSTSCASLSVIVTVRRLCIAQPLLCLISSGARYGTRRSVTDWLGLLPSIDLKWSMWPRSSRIALARLHSAVQAVLSGSRRLIFFAILRMSRVTFSPSGQTNGGIGRRVFSERVVEEPDLFNHGLPRTANLPLQPFDYR